MTNRIVRPVILSGGSGTRLWPVSRSSFPKQLLPIGQEDTMLVATTKRVSGPMFSEAIVVAGEEHRFFVDRQLQAADIRTNAIILEPQPRNTAAAAALAARYVVSQDPDAMILLLPSDQHIGDEAGLLEAVAEGISYADDGAMVMFGARADSPITAYGYIEAGEPADANQSGRPVQRFVEKPDAATAARFIEAGRFFWNCGIFLFRADSFLAELDRLLPETARAVDASVKQRTRDGPFVRPGKEAFCAAQPISIDHGVMEKTSAGVVIPVDIGWSDVGSWKALWNLSPKDNAGNVIQGNIRTIDTSGSFIASHEGAPLIAAIGVKDQIVVAVRDAVFVAPIARASEVKEMVDQLEREQNPIASLPSRVFRPWGNYETLEAGPRFQVKRIVVDPLGRLSLQKHHHRSEHWIVVRGTAEVTVGTQTSHLYEGQSTYIPAGCNHRLANPGKIPLELVEVQCGAYLGEDDIVRLDDVYGRCVPEPCDAE